MSDQKDYPSRQLDMIKVRLPDGMRDHLKQAAKAKNRTMNAEVVERLSDVDALREGAEHLNDEITRLKVRLVELRQERDQARKELDKRVALDPDIMALLAPGVIPEDLDKGAVISTMIRRMVSGTTKEGGLEKDLCTTFIILFTSTNPEYVLSPSEYDDLDIGLIPLWAVTPKLHDLYLSILEIQTARRALEPSQRAFSAMVSRLYDSHAKLIDHSIKLSEEEKSGYSPDETP